ncbi:hypothetical protein A1O3_06770 [Capronia epimyces CBS 606.96]|uniref:Uncharacterized protein n=1 Tax=Capronia epimyces CBS 606.96 TaxID=1182542 RepID=W9XRW8_9EURO|nr:uncharacterized protein A1O3_06770 [Capronia epimyces CBS 606.96]EXJ82953.1 hypothetical protein A1O3_06770 [Capronia epimyces CBS 606.96]
MDERYLETIPEVESLYSRRSSVAANLPELPFRAVPPMTEQGSAYSSHAVFPAKTTFYSTQPYSEPTPTHGRSGSESGQKANVSPISTQESFTANGSDASLVSPIDASFPTSTHPLQSEKPTRSQIPRKLPLPTLQKSPDDIPKKWSLRPNTNGETRWDEYSGEPNQAGKPPSARPGAAPPQEHQYPQLKERTRQILAGLKEREAVKKATWGAVPPSAESDSLDNPVQRPPWKGASGKHAIVEPVKNTPAARTRPLVLLERKNKADGGEVEDQVTARGKALEQAEPTPKSPIDAVSVAASRLPTIKSTPSEESIKPLAPLKGRNTPRVLSLTQKAPSLESPFQSPGPVPPLGEIASSHTPGSFQEMGADSPTLGSASSFVRLERSSSQESAETTVRQPPFQREPDTSSSWDTYATSTVEVYSPAPRSPIPRAQLTSSPDSFAGPPAAVPEPIVLRKRVAANNSGYRSSDSYGGRSPFSGISARKSTSTILRKAVGSNDKPRAVSLMSSLSAGKSLPPTPVELEAADKAASLQARLEDLSRRKRNLNKIIFELRESLKKNAIIYDARKRKEVDKMIINLNLELQDIASEEHETALRLHRVQKRRDKDDFYEEPTGLWIKRVTS